MAEGLGEVVAVNPDTIPDALNPLADQIQNASGRERNYLAMGLGEAVATDSNTAPIAVDTLATRVQNTSNREREYTAKSLGEIIAVSPDATPVEAEVFASQIRNATLEKREHLARGLGELIAADSSTIPDAVNSLAKQIQNTSGDERKHLARCLGEIVAVRPDTIPAPVGSLVELVHHTTGYERRLPAEVLGELVAINPNSTRTAVEQLADYVQHVNDDESISLINEDLGEVVAAISDSALSSQHTTVETILRCSLISNPVNSKLLLIRVESRSLTSQEFIQALGTIGPDNTVNSGIETSLYAEEPVPVNVLKTLAELLKRDVTPTNYPGLRREIQAVLADSTVPQDTKQQAVRVLKQLDSPATTDHYSSNPNVCRNK